MVDMIKVGIDVPLKRDWEGYPIEAPRKPDPDRPRHIDNIVKLTSHLEPGTPMGTVPTMPPLAAHTWVEEAKRKDAAWRTTTASGIASRAAELVGGDRDRQHGQKSDNFMRIATMWSAYLSIRKDQSAPLSAVDVGHMMAAMKLARTQSGALNIDDYVDGAGYLACAGEIAHGAA